jgi:hypothetical protein
MVDIPEKDVERARHIENTSKSAGSDDSLRKENEELRTLDNPNLQVEDVFVDLPEAERKKILRKVDWRLVWSHGR